jgi:hypothetical protein
MAAEERRNRVRAWMRHPKKDRNRGTCAKLWLVPLG